MRVRHDPPLKVTKPEKRTNAALNLFSFSMLSRQRDIGSQFYSGANESITDSIFGLAGLLRNIFQRESFLVELGKSLGNCQGLCARKFNSFKWLAGFR